MKKILILILLTMFLISCSQQEDVGKIIKEKITLVTDDKIQIKANFYPQNTDKALILLHMYDEDKSSWDDFIKEFQKEYNILAIDFRGHGESDLILEELTEKDYNNMVLDVKAAFNFLTEKDIHQITLIGASIGGNTALNFAAEEERVQKVIMISPGLNYKGIKTTESIKKYNRPLFLIEEGYDQYAYKSSNTLFDLSPSKVKTQSINTSFHGTEIINRLPEAIELIKEWLKTN
jgi:pimeloyl-ACP methyl ester carboxylesterase